MEEIWKDVYDSSNYEISNLGRFRNKRNGYLRKQIISDDGYAHCSYMNDDGKFSPGRINRLVAIAFIPNPDNKPTVNHKDGNKLNNCVDNLEWATKEEQMAHAYKLGLKKPMCGLNSPNAKLTKEQVLYIREHYKAHDKEFGMLALAKKFNVSESTIQRVAKQYGTYYRDLD